MDLTLWLAFVAASTALLLIPGPTVLLVLSYALTQGKRVALATVAALNPKSIVFFIAFVPQFITVEAALLPQFVILIGTFVGLAAINALAYALLADRLRNRIARPSVLTNLTRLGGSALVAMGVATALFKRTA